MWVVGASAEEKGIAFPDYAPSSTLSASYIPRNISSQPIILHISTFFLLALLRLVPERKLGRIAMTSIPIISIIIAPVIVFLFEDVLVISGVFSRIFVFFYIFWYLASHDVLVHRMLGI